MNWRNAVKPVAPLSNDSLGPIAPERFSTPLFRSRLRIAGFNFRLADLNCAGRFSLDQFSGALNAEIRPDTIGHVEHIAHRYARMTFDDDGF